MKKYEQVIAGRLMEMAADNFSNHGCNDVEPSLFDGVYVVQRVELERDWNAWNCPNSDPDQYVPLSLIGDSSLMSFFSAKLVSEGEE